MDKCGYIIKRLPKTTKDHDFRDVAIKSFEWLFTLVFSFGAFPNQVSNCLVVCEVAKVSADFSGWAKPEVAGKSLRALVSVMVLDGLWNFKRK